MTHSPEEFSTPGQTATAAAAQPAASAAPAPPGSQALSPAYNDPRRKRPLLASILSIVPGLGQIYVGYYKQGFTYAVTVALLISFLTLEIYPLIPLAAILLGFFWLFNIIDAGRRAALYNQVLAGGGGIELPEDFEMPSLGGSLAGGGALILIGLVLLSHTLLGVSLEWIDSWWPVALVGFGGWLVYKAMQERSGGGSTE